MKYSVQCTWWFLLADCYMYFWQPQKLHDYLFCYKFRSLLRPFLIFVYNFVLECFFYIGISFPVLFGVAALHFSLFLQVLAFARGTEIYFYQVMVFEIACMCLHSKILSFQGSFYKRNSKYRTFLIWAKNSKWSHSCNNIIIFDLFTSVVYKALGLSLGSSDNHLNAMYVVIVHRW